MEDTGAWDCSVCTYKNKQEAFKCQICDTRKGTSTRKPRVTATMVAQQIMSSFPPIPPLPPHNKYQRSNSGSKRPKRSGGQSTKLKNVDRENGRNIEVTVNDLTVVVTDFKLLPKTEDSRFNDDRSNEIKNDD